MLEIVEPPARVYMERGWWKGDERLANVLRGLEGLGTEGWLGKAVPVGLPGRRGLLRRPAPPPKYSMLALVLWGDRSEPKSLAVSITAVPPGKRAFPFHNHRTNEEMFFVLEDEGEVRIGKSCCPIRSGDVIACPAGGPETAHQISIHQRLISNTWLSAHSDRLKLLSILTRSNWVCWRSFHRTRQVSLKDFAL